MVFLEIFVVTFLGLALGSFTTAISYRIPNNIPWAFSKKSDDTQSAYRSACPHCKTPLQALDLIPVFSWLFSKGRCRYCQKPINISYPLIEFSVLALALAAYFLTGFSAPFFWILVAIPFLVALTVIDLKTFTLPDQLVMILFVLGLLKAVFEVFIANSMILIDYLTIYGLGAPIYGLFAWVLGFVVSKILKKDALGFGDVKFFAVAGLWLGWPVLPYFCMLAGILGVVFAVFWRQITKNEVFPFGPALIASFYVVLLIQSSHLSEILLH